MDLNLQQVTKRALQKGIRIFDLPADVKYATNILDGLSVWIDQDLMEEGASSPEAVSLFFPAFVNLPKGVLAGLWMMLDKIIIVGSAKIDELFHEGLVIQVPGHRDAFWDEHTRTIFARPPEEITGDPPGILLHEIAHMFYDAFSQDELLLLDAAFEKGEQASAHPSTTKDPEENFCEAFRQFYLGEPLPPILAEMMRSFNHRASTSKRLEDFLEGR